MKNPTIEESGLTGEVAIITGGSRGIGRAIVEILATAGMEVVFTYRENSTAAQEVIAAHPDARITAEPVDSRDAAACNTLAEKTFDRTGRIDVLVNNAGVVRDNLLAMLDDDDIRTVLETNVTGTMNMSRAVIPHMMARRCGKIINLSSVSGEKGGRGQTNYAASKGAINAFTKSLAVELASRSITVNAVAPGVIETEMSRAVREMAGDMIKEKILLRRVGRPEEVANAVWFLASHFSDYINGQVLSVDGGFKME